MFDDEILPLLETDDFVLLETDDYLKSQFCFSLFCMVEKKIDVLKNFVIYGYLTQYETIFNNLE